ncbi:MAG: hypothetical protein LBV36_06750 [Chromatiales bacterium]|jgi:hypothetical protein|nr:hypothetical protein [Chromatiales bacterium]
MSDEEKQSQDESGKPAPNLDPVHSEWGAQPDDHFGYASDEERLAKRGLEDWELVDRIPESQRNVPVWFIAIIVMVFLVAIGLSFPFWGDRPGYEREWVNWGFGAAIAYILVFGAFVYFMVQFYGSNIAGRLDSDKQSRSDESSESKQDASGKP